MGIKSVVGGGGASVVGQYFTVVGPVLKRMVGEWLILSFLRRKKRGI